MSSYAKYNAIGGSGSSIATPVSVANGGTNSSTALNNGFMMVSSGGAIVESKLQLDTATAPNITVPAALAGAGNILTITGSTGVTAGGRININGGTGGSTTGGGIFLTAGASSSASQGGNFNGIGGANSSTGNGGGAIVTGGAAAGAGNGGGVTLTGGTTATGTAGGAVLQGGRGTGSGAGGNVSVAAGQSSSGTGGQITLGTGSASTTVWLTLDVSGGFKYQNYHVEPSQASVTGNGATTVDLSTASGFKMTLTANATVTLSNPQLGSAYAIEIVQGSGPFTVSWPAAVKWPGGTAPVISAANGAIDQIHLYYDGTIYLGTFVQNFQ